MDWLTLATQIPPVQNAQQSNTCLMYVESGRAYVEQSDGEHRIKEAVVRKAAGWLFVVHRVDLGERDEAQVGYLLGGGEASLDDPLKDLGGGWQLLLLVGWWAGYWLAEDVELE